MQPSLYSERLSFRPLSLQHCSQQYIDWLNDEEVYRYLETGGNYTIQQLQEYLTQVEKSKILFWAIHLKGNDKHIGNIKIDPINKRHGLGEYGILMGDKTEWRKGYSYEASQTIIDYCFGPKINLRKMTLGVIESNTGAVLLYKKLGFEIEGLYKNHGFYAGKYHNVLRMALFNSNYINEQ